MTRFYRRESTGDDPEQHVGIGQSAGVAQVLLPRLAGDGMAQDADDLIEG